MRVKKVGTSIGVRTDRKRRIEGIHCWSKVGVRWASKHLLSCFRCRFSLSSYTFRYDLIVFYTPVHDVHFDLCSQYFSMSAKFLLSI